MCNASCTVVGGEKIGVFVGMMAVVVVVGGMQACWIVCRVSRGGWGEWDSQKGRRCLLIFVYFTFFLSD